jgi:hypothetical protein
MFAIQTETLILLQNTQSGKQTLSYDAVPLADLKFF